MKNVIIRKTLEVKKTYGYHLKRKNKNQTVTISLKCKLGSLLETVFNIGFPAHFRNDCSFIKVQTEFTLIIFFMAMNQFCATIFPQCEMEIFVAVFRWIQIGFTRITFRTTRLISFNLGGFHKVKGSRMVGRIDEF